MTEASRTHPARVLIVDDHAMVRAAIAVFLKEEADLKVAAEASSSREAIELIRKQDFDVVLLDISMPGQSGIDCLGAMREIKPSLPILIFSGFPARQYAVQAIRAGARGFVCKSAPSAEIVRAIRLVAKGGTFIGDEAAEIISDEVILWSDKKPHEVLSEREYQVFHGLVRGHTVTQVAHHLGLSVKTVSTYRARTMEKMRMKTNAELASYAFRHSLVEDGEGGIKPEAAYNRNSQLPIFLRKQRL